MRGARMPQFADRPVTLLFEEQVRRNPEATAIVCEDRRLSYGELNARANQLARHLRSLGVESESLVGICIDRSVEMAVGILGILKAGAGYLPLDPEYPRERLAFMIEDAKPAVVLTKTELKADLPANTLVVLFDTEAGVIAQQSTENLDETPSPVDLAYVIYTSGSTGQPKGVMIEHSNISNYVLALNHELQIEPHDIYLHTASIAFSSSRRQLLLPLSQGATVIIANSDQRKDPIALFQMIKRRSVTVMDAVPSFWRNCTTILESLDEDERRVLLDNRLRLMLSASEPLSTEIPRTWMAAFNHPAHHVHMFGQTETAGIVCLFKVPREFDGQNYVPIGHPIANTEVRILNEKQERCAIDEAGELYIGGAGVGRGYLNRPDLTAEKFIDLCGTRFYRTGDWARLGADGRIEFAGRRDQQVKLRGFRVELGEIEAALSQHPGVRECAVVARNGHKHIENRLLAYYVRRNGVVDKNELRSFMNSRLPDYSVPSIFVELKALPLSANGKVNRLALPEPAQSRAGVSATFVAPQSNLESRLANIWAEVLHTDQIGRDDNFIELGGHSLLAAQIIARIRRELKVEAPISLLLEQPTIASLAASLSDCESSAADSSLLRFDRNGTAPLSFNQQQFWLLDQSSTNRSAYNVRAAVRINGPLCVAKLQDSIDAIVARHEVLRTQILEHDGVAIQSIAPSVSLPLALADLSTLAELDTDDAVQRALNEESARPFDLSRAPLMRTGLLKLEKERHVLVLTLHHIICDAWSIDLLLRELLTTYRSLIKDNSATATALPIQYADFALWQRSDIRAETFANQIEYWKKELAGAPKETELPVDYARPVKPTFAGGRVTATLSREVADALRQLSRSEGATMFMTLLVAFQTLLLRYTGQEDLLVGAPVAGRSTIETENLIGAFVNTIVLRGDLTGNPTFREMLSRGRRTSLAAFANQDVPFERVVEELKPERKANQTPLFQVMFSYQNVAEREFEADGATFTYLKIPNDFAKFDLTLEVEDARDGLSISFEFAKDLFAPKTIERLLSYFQNLLAGVVSNPEQRVMDLPLLSNEEREQMLVEWNSNTLEIRTNVCVYQLFEAQAAKTPEAIAAEFKGETITYGELNARANQLANHLRKSGVGPEVLVGISVERSLEMLIAVFGVLKAGGGYVPLDPSYPQERLAFTIDDAKVSLVVTTQQLAGRLPSGARLLCLDREWRKISKEPDQNLGIKVAPNNIAYVIYTSGSTGNPKGVAIEHRSLTNFIFSAASAYEITSRDRMLQFASLSFDLSVEEIFLPLTQGGTLVLRTEEMISSPRDFLAAVEKWKLSILDLPTAYWHELTDALVNNQLELSESVRLVIIGGEKAAQDRVAAWHARVGNRIRLLNTYGPTETTVAVTWCELKNGDTCPSGVIPIGRPFANARVYVLDSNLQPVPIGVTGELYIGGPGVARGYINRWDLTAEKFIRDPFSADPNDRLYRTGDKVRFLADGQIEFLGRIDNQIKIRGFRVELEEIEKALRAQSTVKDCVVVYDEEQKRLLAYLVPANPQPSIADLRNSLKAKLPSHMVPAIFEVIPALPTTVNGKVDRRALPKPTLPTQIDEGFAPPSTPIEELLASAWCEALRIQRVGAHDNFFDLGGHSLLAAKVVSLVRNQLNLDFTIVDLFQAPTVSALAELLAPRVAEREAREEFDRLMEEIAALTEIEAQDLLDAEFERPEKRLA